MKRNEYWQTVSDRTDALAKHLRKRFEAVGSDASQERSNLEASVQGLVTVLDDLRTSTSTAVRDPKLRQDLTELMASLRAAVRDTVDATAGRVVPRRGGSTEQSGATAAKGAQKAAPRPPHTSANP